METSALEPVRDGYRSWGGGDVSALAPGDSRPDQFWRAVNTSIDGRRLSQRPGWEFCRPTFDSEDGRRTWETGLVQGSKAYGESLVVAIDGNLFQWEPRRNTVRLVNPREGRPLSKFARHIWFEVRAGSLVAQDGINPPPILTDRRSRLAAVGQDYFSSGKPQELRVGSIMADCAGRLHVASPGKRKFWSSDHEMDKTATPWTFQEADDYYLGASSIQAPSAYGGIRAMAPFFDSELLAVFYQKRLRLYAVAQPRGSWAQQDIVVRSLARGCAGHRAVVPFDNLIYFVDQDGRLTSLAEVQESQGRLEIRRIDNEVVDWIQGETEREKESIHLVDFAGRLLRTCGPEAYAVSAGSPDHRTGIRWRGLLSLNYDIKSTLQGVNPAAWEQLWTGPNVTSMDVVDVDGEPRLYAMSRDDDGSNRLYRLRPDRHYDEAPNANGNAKIRKRIKWRVHLREMDGGERSLRKAVTHVALTPADLRGKVDIRLLQSVDGRRDVSPWFEHLDAAGDYIQEDGLGNYWQAAPQGRPPIVGPTTPPNPAADSATGRRGTDFHSIRPIIEVEGSAAISEFMVELKFQAGGAKPNVACSRRDAVNAKACEPDDYDYNLLSAKPE